MSRSLTIFALGSLLLVSACDSAVKEQEQEEATNSSASNANDDSASDKSAQPKGQLVRDYQGMQPPELTFNSVSGNEMQLSDFSGKPVLVNLWATWCAPCKEEMPALDRLAERYAGQIELLPISQDSKQELVPQYWADTGLTHMKPFLDPENHWLSSAISTETLPTSIYYDAEGREIWRVVGAIDWDSKETDALIAEGI